MLSLCPPNQAVFPCGRETIVAVYVRFNRFIVAFEHKLNPLHRIICLLNDVIMYRLCYLALN